MKIEAGSKTYFADRLVRFVVTVNIKVVVGHGDQIGLREWRAFASFLSHRNFRDTQATNSIKSGPCTCIVTWYIGKFSSVEQKNTWPRVHREEIDETASKYMTSRCYIIPESDKQRTCRWCTKALSELVKALDEVSSKFC